MKHILTTWTIRDGGNEYEHQAIIKTKKKFSDELFKQILEKFYFTRTKYTESLDAWKLDGDYRLIQSPMAQILDENELNILYRSLHLVAMIQL